MNNDLKAFAVVSRYPGGRQLFRFVQFHESLEAAQVRAARTLAESGLELVHVVETEDPRR